MKASSRAGDSGSDRLPPKRPTARASVAAALLVAAFAVVVVPAGRLLPAPGTPATYQPTDSPALVVLEPVVHAPWIGSWPLIAAIAVGLGIALVGVSVALLAGARLSAVSMAVIILLTSSPFVASVRHGADAVVALLLVWVCWALLLASRGGDRGLRPIAAIVWGASVAMTWLSLVTVPVVLLAWLRTASTRRSRAIAILVVLLVAAAGLLGYIVRMRAAGNAAASRTGLTMALSDVWTVVFDDVVRQGHPRFASADVSGVSVLWALLAAAALLTRLGPGWWRTGVAASGIALAFLCVEWPAWRAQAVQWFCWTVTPLAAVGLTGAVTLFPSRWRPVALTAIGLALVGSSVASALQPSGSRDTRAFLARVEATVEELARGQRPVAIVAEDTLIDSAFAASAAAPRLPQDPDVIGRALVDGYEPIAGPSGRANLELLGYRFEVAAVVDAPVPFALSRVAERFRCAPVRNDRWSLLPGVEYTGRLGIDIPPGLDTGLTLIVGDDLPPQLRGAFATGETFEPRQQALMSGPGAGTPPPDYWLDAGDPALSPPRAVRVTLPGHPLARRLVSLFLGRRAPRVLARLDGSDSEARGRVCAAPLGPDALWGAATRDVQVPLDAAAFYGVGWHGVEGIASARFRWTASDAVVLVPTTGPGPVRVRLDAAPAAPVDGGGPALTLRVNGQAQPAQQMRAGVQRYEWIVPTSVWVPGTNELMFSVSRSVRPADTGARDTRVLGLRVEGLRLSKG